MSADLAERRRAVVAARALLVSAHAGPTLAVTGLIAALAAAAGGALAEVLLVAVTVFVGQLSIGWSNDLIDRRRDADVGRTDKPLVAGDVPVAVVAVAGTSALVLCAGLSFASGPLAGTVHLGCVAAGWLYNLGLKASLWSWLPYAVAFGGLAAFAALAVDPAIPPPWWWPVGAALIGVGAHLLNVLPDLDDDARTGVHGLPHRLGARRIPAAAVTVLLAATAVVLGGARPGFALGVAAAATVLVLAVVALRGRGRVPFAAAVGIAVTDVILLLVVAR